MMSPGTSSRNMTPQAQSTLKSEQFASDSFNPKKFAQQNFANQGVSQVQEVHDQLLKLKGSTAEGLKTNVYDHYPKFINASQEIGNLEADLLELGNILGDVKSTINGLKSVSAVKSNGKVITNPKAISSVRTLTKEQQFIVDLPMKLDVAIGERQFEKAVQHIEQAKKLLREKDGDDAVLTELNTKTKELVEILIQQLVHPTIKSAESRRIIELLLRLGIHDKATELYLSTRSDKMERDIKKLKLEGDITLYVSELARLVFSALSSVCADFRSAFRDQQNFKICGLGHRRIGKIWNHFQKPSFPQQR
eukprot:TRINITY_DN5389_c0_g1_i5.p2 TRINITY_DN5389_c0_g1~~TRINITY_DN5389_c0_g1_i5.p2  ORF type:complete len:351 (+),score=97.45 TRINITY_DN5389_c0_g1_i5:133-1053(+)